VKKIFAMVVLTCALVVALGPISGCPKGTSKKDTAAGTGSTPTTTDTPKATDTPKTDKKTDNDIKKTSEAPKTTDTKVTETTKK
jgi:hypothetical protein